VSIKVNAGNATVGIAANAATSSHGITAGNAAVTVTANSPSKSTKVNAGNATVTVQAFSITFGEALVIVARLWRIVAEARGLTVGPEQRGWVIAEDRTMETM
jgi:hypothetical protein